MVEGKLGYIWGQEETKIEIERDAGLGIGRST